MNCLADGLAPIPHSTVPSTHYDMKLTGLAAAAMFFGPQLLLPVDGIRHVGERSRWWWPKLCRRRSKRRRRSSRLSGIALDRRRGDGFKR
jgi:hypothetical protein